MPSHMLASAIAQNESNAFATGTGELVVALSCKARCDINDARKLGSDGLDERTLSSTTAFTTSLNGPRTTVAP